MNIISDELKNRLENYPLYSQDNKGKEAICLGILYIGNIRWFILEGGQEDNDTILYSIVCGMCETEYGYNSLNEMRNINIDRNGMIYRIQEVSNFTPTTLKNIKDEELQSFLNRMYD